MQGLAMKISNNKTQQLIAIVVLLTVSQFVGAQSNSIIGGGTIARDCYLASQTAATTGFTSKQDLQLCDDAILFGKLNNRDVAATFVNRGIIKVALQDFNGGLADYEKAMSLQPNKAAEAYINRGNLWLMAQKYDKAIDDYQTALDRGVSKPYVAVLNTGLAYEYLGELPKAKQHYEQALLEIPEWPTAIEKLNRVNLKLQKAAE